MPRINGSAVNPFGGNNSYIFVEYTVTGQSYPNNTSTIEWRLGFHFGDAHIRLDNAQCALSGGTMTGKASGGPISTGWPPPGGTNQDITLTTGTVTVTHDSSGQRTVSVTASVSTDWGSSTINTSFNLAQIPQSPASPSSASASRVSDSQASVSWTNNSTSTAPYAGVKVYRQTDGGSWALRATLGVVTSYSDTSISGNHRYRYRMAAVGANGIDVGYATTDYIWTTPSAPTNCQASKLSSGNIQVTWTNNANFSEYLIEVQESTDGGDSWSNLATSLAAGTTSYVHTSPNPAVTHRYRVRAKTSSGSTLYSGYSSASNTITLLATANAPTNLSPSGVARDATADIILAWQHNPADGTPQTEYQIEYEVDGGSTVTIGPTASTAEYHTLTGGTLANGSVITWRVKSAGENGTLSAASATASFVTAARPTVAVSAPTSTHNASTLTVEWTYFQEDSTPQASWEAELTDGDGALIERIAGTTEDAGTFSTTLADGASHVVRVWVMSSDGLMSEPDEQAFTVVYLPPAAVSLSATYDRESGCMVLSVTGSPAEDGVTVDIDTVSLQRQIDGGAWVTLAAGLALDLVSLTTVVVDTAPTIRGTNVYRAIAYSALPSQAMSSDVTVQTAETHWAFLSCGDGFATIARLRAAPSFGMDVSRDKALHYFAGREMPVELAGEGVSHVVHVQAMLHGDSSTLDEFRAVARHAGPVLWRDPTGLRVWGSLGRLVGDTRNHRIAYVSFDVTEVDYDEGVSL